MEDSQSMKKQALIAAGCLVFIVMVVFFGLIVFTGSKSATATEKERKKESPDVKFVPPLERILQERAADASAVSAHTKMKPPKIKIFQTLYKEGTQVTFHHQAHVENYQLDCVECHHVESCNRCHAINQPRDVHVTTGKQAFHENCIVCHSKLGGPEKCDECHKQ